MSRYAELFSFHLANGQSIGPGPLRQLWARACLSQDIGVSRKTRRNPDGTQKDTYFLYGSCRSEDLPTVEMRLRQLLAESRLTGYVKAAHH